MEETHESTSQSPFSRSSPLVKRLRFSSSGSDIHWSPKFDLSLLELPNSGGFQTPPQSPRILVAPGAPCRGGRNMIVDEPDVGDADYARFRHHSLHRTGTMKTYERVLERVRQELGGKERGKMSPHSKCSGQTVNSVFELEHQDDWRNEWFPDDASEQDQHGREELCRNQVVKNSTNGGSRELGHYQDKHELLG